MGLAVNQLHSATRYGGSSPATSTNFLNRKKRYFQVYTAKEILSLFHEELETSDWDKNEKKYGSVMFKGKEYVLTQQAFPEKYRDMVRYYDHAKDRLGNDYLIGWDTTDEYDARDDSDKLDESDACDWENPVSIKSV